MKYHVLTATHMFDLTNGRYSLLTSSDGFLQMWLMEREWNFNKRNVSSIPRDEYVLQPHNGKKYKNTYAVIGDAVGHTASDDKPRFACVFHSARYPSELQGCLAPAESIDAGGGAVSSPEAIVKLLAYLDRHTSEDQAVKILLNQ